MSSSGPSREGSREGTTDEAATVPVGDSRKAAAHTEHITDRYVVIETLGAGGMGTVLRAYDVKLRREVALKQLRADALDTEGEARLLREAQAMAQLSHPNVVSVYDVEIHSRTVTIAMELVTGQTLKEWLRARTRRWTEIVAVFRKAGRGLAAAHHAALVHRDFKPANVLLGSSGDVKVTDFGLAKPFADESGNSEDLSRSSPGERSDESLDITETGVVMGTPRYMAPEQHAGEATTASSDQYAFCVALWEALTGAPPFSGRGMAAAKHRGPPPWPKTPDRIPTSIVDALRRGLARAPEERWPSMEALLEVLGPERTSGHRRWALAATALALGLGGGLWLYDQSVQRAQLCTGATAHLVGVWDDARSAQVEAAMLETRVPFAARVWDHARADLQSYADRWVAQHVDACEATNLRGEQSASDLDLRVGCLRRARGALAEAVDVLAQADPQVVENALEVVEGLPSLSRCADVEALRVDFPLPEDATVAAAVEEHRTMLARARSLRRAGLYEAAYAVEHDLMPDVRATKYPPLIAEGHIARGRSLTELGRYDEAEADLREGMRESLAVGATKAAAESASLLASLVGYRQARPAEGIRLGELAVWLSRSERNTAGEAHAHNALGLVFLRQGRHEDAEAQHREALAQWEAARGPDHPSVSLARANLAYALFEQGQYETAASEQRAVLAFRQAHLGPDHPNTAKARGSLATTLFSLGQYKNAESEVRKGIELLEAAVGAQHPDVIMLRTQLANTLHVQGLYAESEVQYRKILALRRAVQGAKHPETGVAQSNLGLGLHWQGLYADAEKEFRGAIVVLEAALGPTHPQVAMAKDNLGLTLHALRRDEEAVVQHRSALEIREAQLGPDHPAVAASRDNLAYALHGQGNHAEAEHESRKALAVWENALGPSHPEVSICLQGLGEMVRAQGRLQDARELFERAWTIRKEAAVGRELVADTAFALAEVSWELGDHDRALELADSAQALLAEAGDGHGDKRKQIDLWLAQRPPSRAR